MAGLCGYPILEAMSSIASIASDSAASAATTAVDASLRALVLQRRQAKGEGDAAVALIAAAAEVGKQAAASAHEGALDVSA